MSEHDIMMVQEQLELLGYKYECSYMARDRNMYVDARYYMDEDLYHFRVHFLKIPETCIIYPFIQYLGRRY